MTLYSRKQNSISAENMQLEYDPGRLIDEVKIRPNIWDHRRSDFRMRDKRFKAFKQIIMALMPDEQKDEMTKSDLRELVFQIQKKWKNIKDNFIKSLAHPEKFNRPYIYSKKLKFLTEMPSKKLVVIKPECTDENEDTQESSENEEVIVNASTTDQFGEDIDNHDDEANTSTPANHSTANEGFFNVASHLHNPTEEFAFVDSRSDTDDAERMFLLSLLPHLKSIPEEFRLNVKLELMQVIKNASISVNNVLKGSRRQ